MPEWNDATSYRHGERGVIEPSSWAISGPGFSVVVVRGHVIRRALSRANPPSTTDNEA